MPKQDLIEDTAVGSSLTHIIIGNYVQSEIALQTDIIEELNINSGISFNNQIGLHDDLILYSISGGSISLSVDTLDQGISYTLKLPNTIPSNNKILKVNSSNELVWSDIIGISGTIIDYSNNIISIGSSGNDATVNYNVGVTGDVGVDNIDINFDLSVSGLSAFYGLVDIFNDFGVSGNSSFYGLVDIFNDLSITGNSTLQGLLNVYGASSLIGDIGITGNSILQGNVDIVGNLNLSGNTLLCGNVEICDDLIINGSNYISGNLGISGNSTLLGTLGVSGNSHLCGNVIMCNDLGVSGNTSLSGNLGITGNTIQQGSVEMIGNLSVTGDTHLCGNVEICDDLTVNGNSIFNSLININSGVNISGAINANGGVTGIVFVAKITDEKTIGTNGGTFTSGSWYTRTLNTLLDNNNILLGITNNTFIVAPGLYQVQIQCPAVDVKAHQCRLYNVTDNIVEAIGTNAYNLSSQGYAFLFTLIEFSGNPRVYRVEHRCEFSRSGYGFGQSNGWGTEIYTQVLITKVTGAT